MKIAPYDVLNLLGIECSRVYPTAMNCPLCSGIGKLEMRSPTHIHCRGCYFTGDLIELLALARDEDLSSTVEMLDRLSLVDTGGSVTCYIQHKAEQAKIQSLIRKNAEFLKEGVPGPVQAIFQSINCRHSDRILQGLAPHICVMQRKEFDEAEIFPSTVPKHAKAAYTWWAKYKAIVIPSWDATDIVGLWLITTKGVNYMPLTAEGSVGNAFAHVASFTAPNVVVMDDIVEALRFTLWSVFETSEPAAFVVPFGIRDNAETYKSGNVVFWSPTDDTPHYIRALGTPASRTLTLSSDQAAGYIPRDSYPCQGSFVRFSQLASEASHSHQGLAHHLLDLKPADARAHLVGASIDPSDQARVLSQVRGNDHKFIADLFRTSVRDETVTFDGVVVTDTPDGWMARGKIISTAKLYVDRYKPAGTDGGGMAYGTIHCVLPNGERKTIEFSADVRDLRAHPGNWVSNKIFSETGFFPRIDTRWGKQLLYVAELFHVPKADLGSKRYGWIDDKLCLPNFVVDSRGLYSSPSGVEGPAIQLPGPMSGADWSSFEVSAFCRIFLAIMGNIVRTRSGRNGIGIMLANEQHVVSRLASAMGSSVRANPTVDEIEANNQSPLPLFTEWADHSLCDLFLDSSGFRNVVLSVDSHTDRVARIQPDWLHLSVGSAIDYTALRSIFLLLPDILKRNLEIDSQSFYRDIAETLNPVISDKCPDSVLYAAASSLDNYNTCRNDNASGRIMELFFEGVRRGAITPKFADSTVHIDYLEFLSFIASPIIPTPSPADIRSILEDARYLAYDARTAAYWPIHRHMWSLHESIMMMD